MGKQNPTNQDTVMLKASLLQQVKIMLHLIQNKVNKACPAYPEELAEVNKDVMAVPGKTRLLMNI